MSGHSNFGSSMGFREPIASSFVFPVSTCFRAPSRCRCLQIVIFSLPSMFLCLRAVAIAIATLLKNKTWVDWVKIDSFTDGK